MRRTILLTSLAAILFGVGATASAGPASSLDIQVMTQNQYVGGDLFSIIPAVQTGDPATINAAVVRLIQTMSANRTVDRVKALSNEVLARKPHLLGLQEVWRVSCEPADAPPCTNADLAGAWGDHLEITAAALGAAYTQAGYIENFTYGFFFQDSQGHVGYASILDRDAIFVRSDVNWDPVVPGVQYPCDAQHISVNGCTYNVNLPIEALGPDVYVNRGFLAVDATVGGRAYRFVDTHLENGYADGLPGIVQSAQAFQLINTTLGTTPGGVKLILVGDTNSAPTDAVDPTSAIPATPYMLFAAAGLFDVWLYRPGNVAGLSCCQAENLMNRASMLSRRIDLILTREMPRIVKDARVVGEVAADRLGPPGRSLWPTDHASVAAWWNY